MDEIELALARLKKELAPLNRKVNRLLHLKYGIRMVGALMILASAVVWGGLPLSLLGGGIVVATMLIPNGRDSGPDVDHWRLLMQRKTAVEELRQGVRRGLVPASEGSARLREILSEAGSTKL